MKKFVGFYYRCSFKVCLCAFLSLIGLTVLSSSVFAAQYGDYVYSVSNGTVIINEYIGAGGDVVIPPTINGMPVVAIWYNIDYFEGYYYGAFEDCTNVTSVTIPSSVTRIGSRAFFNCSGLTSVIIPNSVTSIENYAFSHCSGLTSVTIGSSVTSIGDYAFSYCTGLTSVIIPDSVTSIGGSAFEGCTGITSVTIGNSVTSIGREAFYHCAGLTSVIIPNSVTSIGGYAFRYCTGLTSVTIPDSVTSIGYGAFSYCDGLTGVTIPASVTSIGDEAFRYCDGLTSIVVDESNTIYSSQDGVLYNKAMTTLIQCPGGKSGGFTIPDSVMSIGGSAFSYCTGLTSVTIGNSVTSIENGAFSHCSGLTSVNILDSVTSIGFCAFELCSGLTSVTIPGSVTSIGNYAFQDCTSLAKAYFLGNAPSMGGSQVFNNCASNFSICYTAGSTGFTTPTWYGYPAAVCVPPTVINLFSFIATPKAGKVILQWTTASEIDNAGFNIYRSEAEDGEYKKINNALIAAEGSSTQGASYEFIDGALRNRKTYYYKLEDIDLNGTSTLHGPVSATPRLILGIFGK